MPINNDTYADRLDQIEGRLKKIEKRESEDFVGIYSHLDDLENKFRRLEFDLAAIHLNNR